MTRQRLHERLTASIRWSDSSLIVIVVTLYRRVVTIHKFQPGEHPVIPVDGTIDSSHAGRVVTNLSQLPSTGIRDVGTKTTTIISIKGHSLQIASNRVQSEQSASQRGPALRTTVPDTAQQNQYSRRK